MKKILLAYQLSGQTIGVDITTWDSADLNGNKPFKFINDGGTIPTDYVDISTIENWDNYGTSVLSEIITNEQIIILIQETGVENLSQDQLMVISAQTETLGFGSEYFTIKNDEALITFSKTYVDYIDLDIYLLGGTYKILWSAVWSHDSAKDDFKSRILLNDSNIINEYIIEPKESGGAGVGGTNQRYPLIGFDVRELESGNNNIKLQLATESSGSESTIYNGVVEIYRVK